MLTHSKMKATKDQMKGIERSSRKVLRGKWGVVNILSEIELNEASTWTSTKAYVILIRILTITHVSSSWLLCASGAKWKEKQLCLRIFGQNSPEWRWDWVWDLGHNRKFQAWWLWPWLSVDFQSTGVLCQVLIAAGEGKSTTFQPPLASMVDFILSYSYGG